MDIDFDAQTLLVYVQPEMLPVDLWGATHEFMFPADGSGLTLYVRPSGSTPLEGSVITSSGDQISLIWNGKAATAHIKGSPETTELQLFVRPGSSDAEMFGYPMPKLVLKPTDTCPPPPDLLPDE